jgi:hypothetical protein
MNREGTLEGGGEGVADAEDAGCWPAVRAVVRRSDRWSGVTVSGLFLAEEAPSDCLADRRLWSKTKEVGRAGPILREQRQGTGATGVGFRSGLQEHRSEPVFNRVDHLIIAVMSFSIGMTRGVPVLIAKQLIPQQADTSQRQCESLTEGRITGCCRVSDQRDSLFVGVLHPAVIGVKVANGPTAFACAYSSAATPAFTDSAIKCGRSAAR